MNTLAPTIPEALTGVDLTKFTKDTITLDENKSFDENLQANFGISADQAAELINYAMINAIPVSVHTPDLVPTLASASEESTQTGGVMNAAEAMAVFATMVSLIQSGQQAVNYVTSAIALVDGASRQFVDTSTLAKTAEVWRSTMERHCPEIVNPPVQCSYLDLKCKLWDYKKTATAAALFKYNSDLCSLATQRYTEAIQQVPLAERKAIEASATAFSGTVNLVNKAAIPTKDFEKLKKDKIIEADGKVIDSAKFEEYVMSKLKIEPSAAPKPAAAAAAPSPAASFAATAAAEQARQSGVNYEAGGGQRARRKTGKSKGKKRTTFRRRRLFLY